MNAAFLKAAIPQPFQVLLKPLRPLSVGHEVLLCASHNAFSNYSDREPTHADLILAVRICQFTYAEAIKRILTGKREFEKWMDELHHTFDKEEMDREMQKFRAYLTRYRTIPEYVAKATGQRSVSGAPFEHKLKVFLCTEMGVPYNDAMDVPFNQAVCDYLTFAESNGVVTIVDSLAELEAEALAQHADTEAKAREMLQAKEDAACL